jgi:hypothetical protein
MPGNAAGPDQLIEYNDYTRDIFVWSSPLLLAGSIARALAEGGAYAKLPGIRAKQLGDAFAHRLLQDRYEDFLLFESGVAWSNFFHDIAWDGTWVLIDKRNHLIHILMATDTD